MSTNDQEFRNARTAGEAAAAWWISVLQNPKFDNGADDPSDAKLTAFIRATRPPYQKDSLNQFATNLAKRLDQQLIDDADKYMVATYGICIGVDYTPDLLLSECAKQAGLPTDIASWPWKTGMSVKPDEVSVMYGYTADLQVIWTKP